MMVPAPPKPLVVEFTKMSGAGNDFVTIDNRFYNFSIEELAAMATQVCPRRHAIGADGILALSRPLSDRADYRMDYLNADGTIGTMCGNGARCIARFARSTGQTKDSVVIETESGLYRAEVPRDPDGWVRIRLPVPERHERHFELRSPMPANLGPVHFLCPGTEHLVCFCLDVAGLDVSRLGTELRRDPALDPNGANVNFVAVDGKGADAAIQVRTYEKGVEAETLACGTGAVASAVAAIAEGLIDRGKVRVRMTGGTLEVSVESDYVWLSGPASAVYRGTFAIEP